MNGICPMRTEFIEKQACTTWGQHPQIFPDLVYLVPLLSRIPKLSLCSLTSLNNRNDLCPLKSMFGQWNTLKWPGQVLEWPTSNLSSVQIIRVPPNPSGKSYVFYSQASPATTKLRASSFPARLALEIKHSRTQFRIEMPENSSTPASRRWRTVRRVRIDDYQIYLLSC